ncbi:MAG TPA: LamG domain-containing protein [Opitutaceae bacterium]|nr:LamG domain-containing protein [Opitutaceae bacterium]
MRLPGQKAGRLGVGLAIATLAWAAPGGNPSSAGRPLHPVVWTFDTLASIGGYTPTVLGTPRLTDAGHALWFNGVDAGLILAVNPLAGLREFTIEVLLDPAAGGGAAQRFFHAEDEGASRVLLEIRLTREGRWALDTFLFSGRSGLALLDRTKLHPTGRWHWVALRYDGQRMTSYVNGQMELEGTLEFSPMKPGRTSLGVRLNQVSWFKGAIREVRIHPTALDGAALQRVP